MAYASNVQASFNRKRRKEIVDMHTNKKQSIVTKAKININKKSLARHKRYLLLKRVGIEIDLRNDRTVSH
jgi:hypothetical protein